MIYPDRVSYAFLQIDRPILAGGDEFLLKVAQIGNRVLGTVMAGSLPETHIDTNDFVEGGGLRTTLQTLSLPRAEVFRASELRMVLFRRVVPNEMSGRFNFSAKAVALNEKRSIAYKRQQNPTLPVKSSKDQLDEIAKTRGQNPAETPVICDRIVDLDDPVFGRSLALAPQVGHDATWTLGEQAKLSFETIKKKSIKLAFASNALTPMVPFVSLPPDIKPTEYQHFVEAVNETFINPVRLIMGAVEAYSASATGKVFN